VFSYEMPLHCIEVELMFVTEHRKRQMCVAFSRY